MSGNIGIFGDSWGCGVWGKHNEFEHYRIDYGVTHLGIQHFLWLRDNSSGMPYNFSEPGGSNAWSMQKLKRYHQDFDVNIFIVTEPFRDFWFSPDLYDTNKTFKQNWRH